MTLGQYIRLVLTADAGVFALVGARVYSETMPQSPDLPLVVYGQSARLDDQALDGPTGVQRLVVQVDSWAKTRAEATALGAAVVAALSGHSGAADGLSVQGVFLGSERWDYEPEVDLYRTAHDYEVWIS